MDRLKSEGRWKESVSKYKDVIRVGPTLSINAYNDIAMVLGGQGKWEEAIAALKSALEYNARAEVKRSVSDIHYNIGTALQRLGRNKEASEYMYKAIQGYRKDLAKKPDSIKIVTRLGNALARTGQFNEATKYLRQSIDINPFYTKNYITLAWAFAVQERYDEAIERLRKGIGFMLEHGRGKDTAELQRYLQSIEDKSTHKEN